MVDYLRHYLRDELIAWYAEGVDDVAGVSVTTEIVPNHRLAADVAANVDIVVDRLVDMGATPDVAGVGACRLNQRVCDLVDAAQNTANLAAMPVTWMPWL